jgi:endonuclease-8
MPEGPSIVILKEELQLFKGKKVLDAYGNARIDIARAKNKTVRDLKSWGKHFLICFDGFFFRVHFLMFGSYRINEERELKPRLSLRFSKGFVNFYTCSIKLIDGSPNDIYTWSRDVMSPEWDPSLAKRSVKKLKDALVCDVLLNQDIFSGVGNIIKNEVLFRIKVHPLSKVSALSPAKLKALINEASRYSFDFYEWKKRYELKKHWLVYKQKCCPVCDVQLTRTWSGKTDRLTFFCPNCQHLYE